MKVYILYNNCDIQFVYDSKEKALKAIRKSNRIVNDLNRLEVMIDELDNYINWNQRSEECKLFEDNCIIKPENDVRCLSNCLWDLCGMRKEVLEYNGFYCDKKEIKGKDLMIIMNLKIKEIDVL